MLMFPVWWDPSDEIVLSYVYVCTRHMSLFALHYKKAKHGLGFFFWRPELRLL